MDDDAPNSKPGAFPALAGGGIVYAVAMTLWLAFVAAGWLPWLNGLSLWPLAWGALVGLVACTRMGALPAGLLSGVTGLGALVVILSVNFKAVRVEGDSMLPGLQRDDVLLVDLTDGTPRRFGVYVIERAGKDALIKRAVGLPGEHIEARYGRVFAAGDEVYPRDGSPSDEDYRERPARARLYGGLDLGDDEYFFLGDNPPVSNDSRHFGAVAQEDVEGRVVWRLKGLHGFGPFRE